MKEMLDRPQKIATFASWRQHTRTKERGRSARKQIINLFTCGCRICDALRESPWRVAPEKQSLKQYNATISKYINLIFCYVI